MQRMSKKLLGIFLAAAVLLAVQGALIHPLEHLLRAQSSSAQEATRLAVSIASHVDEQRSEQRTATTNTPTDTPTNAPTTQHTCLLCVALFDVGHLLTSASASAAPVIALGVAPILALHRDVAVATPPIVYDGRAPPRC
jgi:aromatic ring-opening dioxygenase catalytic subunit (LigB family)